jgi:hypothetical protein
VYRFDVINAFVIAEKGRKTISAARGRVRNSSADIIDLLHSQRCRVLKRLPRASRYPAASKLDGLLRDVVEDPDLVDRWVSLLIFAFQCFGVPGQRGGKRHLSSLASKVNTAIANFPIASPPAPNSHKPAGIKKRSTSSDVAALVSSKLEEGDIRGAIRLAASDDTMAPFDDVTAVALRDKHPARSPSVVPLVTAVFMNYAKCQQVCYDKV